MADAKKAGSPQPRRKTSAPKMTPDSTVEPVRSEAAPPEVAPSRASAVEAAPPPPAQDPAILPEPMQFSRPGKEQADALRAVGAAMAASAQGAFEVNGKILAALRMQGEAALDVWRATLTAPHLSEALERQANGTRQAYEAASAQWKDVAETAARWFGRSLGPLQTAIGDRKR